MDKAVRNIRNLMDTMIECADDIMAECDPYFKPLPKDPAEQDDNPFRDISSFADDIKRIVKGDMDFELDELKAKGIGQ